ncbi:hypothetical protein [Escherichia phage dw-ec]|nr:hypothetical protein [Escherichia phage BI-EHEC]UJQ43802.1 hypothetical protein [Escherichia phage dw-ec]
MYTTQRIVWASLNHFILFKECELWVN